MQMLSSSPFLTPALQRQAAELRDRLQIATSEMTSGRQTDPAASLGGDFSGLAANDHALARLTAFRNATAELTLTSAAMQRALEVIHQTAQILATNLLQSAGGLSEVQLSNITRGGAGDFNTAVNSLNTQVAGKSLFAGDRPDRPALPDSETLLLALETAIAGVDSLTGFNSAVEAWFNDPAGYSAAYLGGNAAAPIVIGPAEKAALPFTALDPALRATLTGFAKITLLDRGLFAGDHALRAAIALEAGKELQSAAEARSLLAGRIGSIEQQLARDEARNVAESSALQITRNAMIAADPYEGAVLIKDLEHRLEAFYAIIARLSQLNLTAYLR